MSPIFRCLFVGIGVTGGLLWTVGSQPEAEAAVHARMAHPHHVHVSAHTTRHVSSMMHRNAHLHTSMIRTQHHKLHQSNRQAGRRTYMVQVRMGGSGKTGLAPRPVADVVRRKMQLAGYSAHLHNFPAGSYVHFHGGRWLNHSVFNNSQAAHQVAAVLRARGVSARVTAR